MAASQPAEVPTGPSQRVISPTNTTSSFGVLVPERRPQGQGQPMPLYQAHSQRPSPASASNSRPASASPGVAGPQSGSHHSQARLPSNTQGGKGPQHPASAPPRDQARSVGRLVSPTGEAGPAGDGAAQSESYAMLAQMIDSTDPSVVRQVIRDRWERCLSGSAYHIAFLLNTSLAQADEGAIDSAIQTFGEKMARNGKANIIRHLNAQDLDQLTEDIHSKASNAFLDHGLARRLETIPAQSLVNALARAERLGYDVQDIVEEKANGRQEQVIPTAPRDSGANFNPPSAPRTASFPNPPPGPPRAQASAPAPATPSPAPGRPPSTGATQAQTWQAPATQPSQGTAPTATPSSSERIAYCSTCRRPCSGDTALAHHLRASACGGITTDLSRFGRDMCLHCGSRFGGSAGFAYHTKHNVCGVYSQQRTQHMQNLLAAMAERNQPSTEAAAAPATTTPQRTPDPTRPTADSNGSPYDMLTPEVRQRFEQEMEAAEKRYGGLMRAALSLPEPQQSEEMRRLKNQYNTKQSTTRKKYGIRLRKGRSKQEISAERVRLFGSANIPQSAMAAYTTYSSHPGSSSSPQPPPSQQAMSGPGPQSGPRVPLAQMNGGLSGSSATAEHVDPTSSMTPGWPPSAAATRGTADDPMQLDDSDSTDDEDIPA